MKDLKQKVQDVVDKTIHQKQQKTVKDQSNAIEEQAKRIAKLSDESN